MPFNTTGCFVWSCAACCSSTSSSVAVRTWHSAVGAERAAAIICVTAEERRKWMRVTLLFAFHGTA
jgi:hypothetical protein